MLTASVVTQSGPILLETFLKHYFSKKAGKSSVAREELLFDEGESVSIMGQSEAIRDLTGLSSLYSLCSSQDVSRDLMQVSGTPATRHSLTLVKLTPLESLQ